MPSKLQIWDPRFNGCIPQDIVMWTRQYYFKGREQIIRDAMPLRRADDKEQFLVSAQR